MNNPPKAKIITLGGLFNILPQPLTFLVLPKNKH